MTPLTPREAARTRLLAAVQGCKPSDLIPGTAGAGGELPATHETAIALAIEFESVALALLAIIHDEGIDMTSALQVSFMALDQVPATTRNAGA